jgi:hypothetical protein
MINQSINVSLPDALLIFYCQQYVKSFAALRGNGMYGE